MELKTLLRQILKLSQKHLQSTTDEDWQKWERLADRKEALYDSMAEFDLSGIGEDPILHEIADLEKATTEIMIKKRDGARKELRRIRKMQTAAGSYRMHASTGEHRHIRFKC